MKKVPHKRKGASTFEEEIRNKVKDMEALDMLEEIENTLNKKIDHIYDISTRNDNKEVIRWKKTKNRVNETLNDERKEFKA